MRNLDETTEGKIKTAIHIPLDDLQGSLDKLAKDKEIIVHCGTGVRAQMAYAVLKNEGYKARFLNDKVAFIKETPTCCFKE